ncbi:MAG: 4-(cytidine 5'-diphospho)-2-C-methyl-D-erythritol kinase [Acidobacteria bacterium]|nr:4-(cytidine 5'-diphospho)-2-C-methyl-D-erythritol kinase [Acidobacteriota bacterium]
MLKYRSYAKINLDLKILRKRDDGYHDISTIFQTISLYDELFFKESDQIIINCSNTGIPTDERNLIYKAIKLLEDESGITIGAEIELNKNIPHGGGLGGGSSNAAVTLLAINEMYSLGYSHEELTRFGALLGSDVPFFFVGGTAHGTGKGEILTPMEDIEDVQILLALPGLQISTAKAYKKVSELLTSKDRANNITTFKEGKRTLRSLTNDFEKILFPEYPLLEDITNRLQILGAVKAGVTGSGSTLFGLFPIPHIIDDTVYEMETSFPQVVFTVTFPLDREEYGKSLREY